jgi:hypothetical protein
MPDALEQRARTRAASLPLEQPALEQPGDALEQPRCQTHSQLLSLRACSHHIFIAFSALLFESTSHEGANWYHGHGSSHHATFGHQPRSGKLARYMLYSTSHDPPYIRQSEANPSPSASSLASCRYSTSDDIFHDGGTWRRTGLVAVALQVRACHWAQQSDCTKIEVPERSESNGVERL